VRLHQPSAFYGVNSRELGSGRKDTHGSNAGLYELASGAEVAAYFDQVMQQQFLPTGRVHYFPMSEFAEGGVIASLVSGAKTQVRATKTVDATYSRVTIPSMRRPPYHVADGVRCVPPNELAWLDRPAQGYVVVGAGKTGMDAIKWLLDAGVDTTSITWIMPRDSWLLDRAAIQPGIDYFDSTLVGFALQMEAAALAQTVDELFERLESTGQLMRIDPNVRPTMYRCATVSQAELEQLRTVTNIVRMGHVRSLDETEIVLENGRIATTPDTLHIDCTADGLGGGDVVPVFNGDRITVQNVRRCQPTFSAAFVGHVEAAYTDDAEKNELCTPIPFPDTDLDWIPMALADAKNSARWNADHALGAWLRASRLDAYSSVQFKGGPTPEQIAVLGNIGKYVPMAIENLPKLIAQLPA
jgi:hypothetical protein